MTGFQTDFYTDFKNANPRSHALFTKEGDHMKLIKLPFKILTLPLIAIVWLASLILKAVTYISTYFFGPVMLITGIVLAVMLFKQRWFDVGICGAIEGACFLILLAAAWMIANMQDLNAFLIRFLQS